MKKRNRIPALLMSITFVFSCMFSSCSNKTDSSDENSIQTDIPASEPTLTLSDNLYNLTEGECQYTAVLRIPESMIQGDASQWADSLTWSLERNADDSPYREDKVKMNVYTGDELKNWYSWGTSGTDGKPLFTIEKPEVSVSDGVAEITLAFKADSFHIDNICFDYSEFTSFVGEYSFSVSENGQTLCAVPFELSLHDGFVAYGDLASKLSELKKSAEEKGRYFDIRCCGNSELGNPQNYVVIADSEASVNEYEKYKTRAMKEPAAVLDELYTQNGKKPHIAVMTNGVHANENPSSDTQMLLLSQLAENDTLDFCSLNGLKSGAQVDKSLFPPDVSSVDGFTGLGSDKTGLQNDYETDASEFFSIGDKQSVNVDELLDNAIMIIGLNENPDGVMRSTRTNSNGFGLNGEVSNQSQQETKNFAAMVNEWNPSVFIEFHGYSDRFIVEPFAPPHEPNFEYDLFAENMIRCAEAFGNAALGSVSALENYNTKYCSYCIPLRDSFDMKKSKWEILFDCDITVGSSYAMINCGSLGFTIESPSNSSAGVNLLKYGFTGMLDCAIRNRDDIYKNQLTYFMRACNNEDHRSKMQKWYVDSENQPLPADTWRTPYPETNNFFPEYYIIPTDSEHQRDVADAWEAGEYLNRNGVEVRKLLADCEVDGTTYKAGSLVVDMHQAKRNYANAVLYDGKDYADSGFTDKSLSAHISLPHGWGFDCKSIVSTGIMDGKLSEVISDFTGVGTVKGDGNYAVISNNGTEAVRAVNSLLDSDKTVGMITGSEHKGDFIASKKVFDELSKSYILSGEYISELPADSYKINRPDLWIVGKQEPYYNSKIEEGYFSKWFKDGLRYENEENMLYNRTYYYDLFAFEKQMGFSIADNAESADIILGSTALEQDADTAIEPIKSGTPYIPMGYEAVNNVNKILQVKYFTINQVKTEAIHRISYMSDSLVTACQKKIGDNVIFSNGCGVFNMIPENAEILIKADDSDCIIAGCCGSDLNGAVEAMAVSYDDMDITAFANSITYYSYQPDDCLFVSNTIFSKSLSETALTDNDFAQ